MAESEQARSDIGKRLMQHRRALYSYVYACVRDEHTTEDILQDVAQVVISSIDSLRDAEKFTAWLFGIARRRVLMHARSARREQVVPPDVAELLAVEAEQAMPAALSERKEFLLECIEELPRNMRDILRQRYDGSVTSVEELAANINRTVQAVYGVLKRLRLKLAACVEQKFAEAEG